MCGQEEEEVEDVELVTIAPCLGVWICSQIALLIVSLGSTTLPSGQTIILAAITRNNGHNFINTMQPVHNTLDWMPICLPLNLAFQTKFNKFPGFLVMFFSPLQKMAERDMDAEPKCFSFSIHSSDFRMFYRNLARQ